MLDGYNVHPTSSRLHHLARDKMRPPQRHRQSIIDAAVMLFRRKGYAGTGPNDLVDASDAHTGSLDHCFPAGKPSIAISARNAMRRSQRPCSPLPRLSTWQSAAFQLPPPTISRRGCPTSSGRTGPDLPGEEAYAAEPKPLAAIYDADDARVRLRGRRPVCALWPSRPAGTAQQDFTGPRDAGCRRKAAHPIAPSPSPKRRDSAR